MVSLTSIVTDGIIQHYHYNPYGVEYRRDNEEAENKTEERFRRDAGIFSGPASLAVLSGVIGMTTKAVSDITAFHPMPSDGGCKWWVVCYTSRVGRVY